MTVMPFRASLAPKPTNDPTRAADGDVAPGPLSFGAFRPKARERSALLLISPCAGPWFPAFSTVAGDVPAYRPDRIWRSISAAYLFSHSTSPTPSTPISFEGHHGFAKRSQP